MFVNQKLTKNSKILFWGDENSFHQVTILHLPVLAKYLPQLKFCHLLVEISTEIYFPLQKPARNVVTMIEFLTMVSNTTATKYCFNRYRLNSIVANFECEMFEDSNILLDHLSWVFYITRSLLFLLLFFNFNSQKF